MAIPALGKELMFPFTCSSRFSQRIGVSLAHLQVQSPLGDTSCRLETGLPTCQGKCSILQIDSSQGAIQGPLTLCNRPVKPHWLFAHHPTQTPERDVGELRAAVSCNPTICEPPVWAINVEVSIATGTAFISLGYTWKAQPRLLCLQRIQLR